MAGLSGNEWAEVRALLDLLVAHHLPVHELRSGAFDEVPPIWAVAEEFGMLGDRCGYCGSWCEVVRPGKSQCPTCEDNLLSGVVIALHRILERFDAEECASSARFKRASGGGIGG